MDEKWDLLLYEFCKLGGIAENVCLREGEIGRGIFSTNTNIKSKIVVPSQLLVKTECICLEDNKIRLKKDIGYSAEYRKFFNYYQDNFSWGGGGKETTELFEKGLNMFPSEIKKLIKKYDTKLKRISILNDF